MMDRLTEPTTGCFLYQLKHHKAVPGEFGSYEAFFDYSMAVRKLGQYEAAGLTPEEVTAAKLALMGKSVAEIKEFDGLTIDRLQELAEADRDGRLVVLPCKENTLVWEISHRINGKHEINQKYFNLTYSRVEDFGKTLFLTREEAEAALKEKNDDD